MTTMAEKAATDTAAEKAPEKRKALGRGLDSLLPGGPRVVAGTAMAPATSIVLPDLQGQAAHAREAVLEIALEAIDRNPYQTRHIDLGGSSDWPGASLQELAESIRASGVIQPVTVRPMKDGRYVLITGERRCKASKIAGKTTIPAIVKHVSDQQAAEMTVIENLQRQDLNCLDEAYAFVMLSQKFGLTQEEIGDRVGISRESVSNYMRLMKLPADVQQHLREGGLDFSHARVLLMLKAPERTSEVANLAVKKHLSVEQLEDIVFAINLPLKKQEGEENKGRARWVDPNVRAAQQQLERILGVRVKIRDRQGKGKIVIEYSTLEDFDRVLEMLKGKQ